jgi:hypothetical protein
MAGAADCACFSSSSICNNKVNIVQSRMHLLVFPVPKHRVSSAARHKNVNSIAKCRQHFTNIVHIIFFLGGGILPSFIFIVTEHINCHTYDQLLYVTVGIVCSHLFITLVKKYSVEIH